MTQALDDSRPRRLQAVSGRVPPHDIDAEESLLGAMLLSRDAIASAVEICGTEDFYKPAHAHVFAAVYGLYQRGEPADPVTVADELRRSGMFESIGDPSLLLSLQVNTPSTANAAHYARIVEEHALLRRLVSVAGEIAELGYSVPEDVVEAVDRAEAMVYEVAQRRVVDTMSPLRDLLGQTLDRIERLVDRGEEITGVPTGYKDLDERLAGLQKSNLLVVGARPAMGKALALDTPVPTPAGWSTMGELAVGDEVFDDTGARCRVDYVSPIFVGHRCYRVTFDDGSAIVADAGHRWLVHDDEARSSQRAPRVVTTEEMVRHGVRRRDAPRANWHVKVAGPIDTAGRELPVDPYELGCRVGDGKCTEIPGDYLRASFKQRLAVLQGLMDTGGSTSGRGGAVAEICLADEHLVGQVHELVCSLGHKPPTPDRRPLRLLDGRTVETWRIRWTPVDPVFRLAQRGTRVTAAHRAGPHTHRAVVAIDAVPSEPVRCIAVSSPSHLFLAGRSMIPTHNTSFALGIVTHAAVHAREPVLLFSLEMSHLELTQRMLCSEARVDATRMRNGRLLESDWPKISDAIGRLGDAPIYIDDNPNVTVMDIRAKARRLKAREGLGLVVVDYLQLMSGHGRSRAENRQVEVSEISRGLKVLARELDIPVIALSQLSRNLEMRQDKRPVLADLRESGSIEQDADVVLFIYRDEVYNPESPDRGAAEIIISKHRNGPTGKVDLAFVDHYTRFADMARV
ncbi:MAG TPA: replicative DNA helicase [Acidimicrobiales bacterium]|nr:replicative DNA helicase [Acidimicrobiales bacterium]